MTDAAGRPLPDLDTAVALAEARIRAVREGLSPRHARLPLRYWRQQAHFTTPAEASLARKAVEGGTTPMARILDRFEVGPAMLADRLGVDVARVERLLARPRRSPMVMLDAEDALALTDAAVAQARSDAADVLCDADWDGDGPRTLRFYRPPGLELGSTARELYSLLWALAERSADGTVPLDGIVFPKVEHPEEVDLIHGMLTETERALGLPIGGIRVAYLVESGWAAAQLPAIAQRAADRLCALVFGLADYSADVGLRAIANEHLLADWARAMIIDVAGAAGVPAVDGMTLDYPVADPSLDAAANRTRFLERMQLVNRDAIRARDLGMRGKWVGHPAQLFAVLLAYDADGGDEDLDAEAAKLEAYDAAVRAGQGATMIGGVMSDRATDRHARAVLRQATAMGRFAPQRALALGVIGPDEVADADAAWRGATEA
ncbi:MAG: aldolase/citrate lyase family protein [Chloroflexota bacterium]